MVMNSYTSRLGKVFENLNYATEQTITKRKFLTATEDPASTARAYQLRKSFQQNNDYLNNVNDVLDTMDSIFASMMVLSNMAENAHIKLEEGRNGVWSKEDRLIFANELENMQRTAVDALNAKFDDKFLFGGHHTKAKEPPFALKDGVLTFRGIDVTTDDPAERAKLIEYYNETIYRDMGFGLAFELDASGNPVLDKNGNPIVKENSAFNTVYSGLKLICLDITDPDPKKNLILNFGLIAEALRSEADKDEPLDYDYTKELWEYLTKQRMNILGVVTKQGADHNFLEKQRTVLEVNSDNLNNKIMNVEFIDMELAINNLKMADYVYRASLEIGTKILTPSFIDFMR